MNPTILLATHDRVAITSKNIRNILSQGAKPVVVATLEREARIFESLGATVVRCENYPLGRKWQKGVDACKDADPLIIVGSDDLLGADFVAKACEMLADGWHFIGLNQFWQHHKGIAYLCRYKAAQPIGGGRVYSQRMLAYLKYTLFDATKGRHLDDYAFAKVKSSGLKYKIVDSLDIHAIKGDWHMMNPFNPNHKNIEVIREEPSHVILEKVCAESAE